MNLDKELFETTISRIDSSLADSYVPIPARPLQAIVAIFIEYHVSGPVIHPFHQPLSFPVNPINLSDHVDAWYEKKYGEKLKIDLSPGRFPILIEGAMYQCKLPFVTGRFTIVGAKGNFENPKILNAIDYILDLPGLVRLRLSAPTMNLLQELFSTCMEVSKILNFTKSELLQSAKSDILISCDLLCGPQINASTSAWLALHFAEKIFKEYISRFEKPPYIHDIERLKNMALKYGYSPDVNIDWEVFNFNASARYSPKVISLNDAVVVNHEAWRVGYNVLKQI